MRAGCEGEGPAAASYHRDPQLASPEMTGSLRGPKRGREPARYCGTSFRRSGYSRMISLCSFSSYP
jgi:hypothetical protein